MHFYSFGGESVCAWTVSVCPQPSHQQRGKEQQRKGESPTGLILSTMAKREQTRSNLTPKHISAALLVPKRQWEEVAGRMGPCATGPLSPSAAPLHGGTWDCHHQERLRAKIHHRGLSSSIRQILNQLLHWWDPQKWGACAGWRVGSPSNRGCRRRFGPSWGRVGYGAWVGPTCPQDMVFTSLSSPLATPSFD